VQFGNQGRIKFDYGSDKVVKTAIMQPYFLPYIGYWQLINSADQFVVYDNIKFTKKGWFNRNRILETNHDRLFTIPIKKASDYLPVNKRYLSDDSDKEILKSHSHM
jgi:hypothetical protein